MKLSIITTTINEPTEATIKFCHIAQKHSYKFCIVGDKKTPHCSYIDLMKKFSCLEYITPEQQESEYKDLSSNIGWNSIQRRNIGFVHCVKRYDSDIIATIDDDNIPYDNWSQDIYIGKNISCDYFEINSEIFDPLSVTNYKYLWHRGFPIELLNIKNNITYKGKKNITPMIQADLWDGDPDIDAICRLTYKPIVKFNIEKPYFSNKLSPFNSQNTFLHKSIMKHYYVLPHIGRMDDIWPSYNIQKLFPNSLIYNRASVYQDRNAQDLIKNLENEIIGYRNTYKYIIENNDAIPIKSKEFIEIYQKLYE